jgi:hypothetical protein
MYTGILVLFGIMWTIYFFLYAWQYDSMGNYSFFLSSYIVRKHLISVIFFEFALNTCPVRSLWFSLLWDCPNISLGAF